MNRPGTRQLSLGGRAGSCSGRRALRLEDRHMAQADLCRGERQVRRWHMHRALQAMRAHRAEAHVRAELWTGARRGDKERRHVCRAQTGLSSFCLLSLCIAAISSFSVFFFFLQWLQWLVLDASCQLHGTRRSPLLTAFFFFQTSRGRSSVTSWHAQRLQRPAAGTAASSVGVESIAQW